MLDNKTADTIGGCSCLPSGRIMIPACEGRYHFIKMKQAYF